MDTDKKNEIYDRLLAIHLRIDLQSIPNPGYINEKIWECHNYIDEIEKFNIAVSKEISVLQQALNNTQANYDMKKENLILSDEIMKLPSIKDREAKANNLLRSLIEEIKEYQNELTDLNNLLKVTNLKIKNLNRANSDIKILLRLLEAQIRMSGPGIDKANKSLLEELSKSTIGEDSFKDAKVEEEKQNIADPSTPLDIKQILDIPENFLDPVPSFRDEDEDESSDDDDLPWIPQDSPTAQKDIPEEPENQIIDLDNVLTEPEKKEVEETKNEKEGTLQKVSSMSVATGELDLDAFLDSIQ